MKDGGGGVGGGLWCRALESCRRSFLRQRREVKDNGNALNSV